MRKERVEVGLRPQVQYLGIVGVIYVRDDSKKLAIDVLDGRGEGLGEVMT